MKGSLPGDLKRGDRVVCVAEMWCQGFVGTITHAYDWGPGCGGDDYEWGVKYDTGESCPHMSSELRLASDVSLLERVALVADDWPGKTPCTGGQVNGHDS